MNRYQFEDLISEYIENNLTLKKRKEFEAYMESHPEALLKVDEIRQTLKMLNSLKKVNASDNFNDELLLKLKEKENLNDLLPKQTLFGFTPIHASLMTGLVIIFIFISSQLINTLSSDSPYKNNFSAKDANPVLQDQSLIKNNLNLTEKTEMDYDSTSVEPSPDPKKELSNKIHFVKD
tara:strand:+ start:835 stop:1368 length:534 start_codon:yes stop_codon:yes gene_type:complete